MIRPSRLLFPHGSHQQGGNVFHAIRNRKFVAIHVWEIKTEEWLAWPQLLRQKPEARTTPDPEQRRLGSVGLDGYDRPLPQTLAGSAKQLRHLLNRWRLKNKS